MFFERTVQDSLRVEFANVCLCSSHIQRFSLLNFFRIPYPFSSQPTSIYITHQYSPNTHISNASLSVWERNISFDEFGEHISGSFNQYLKRVANVGCGLFDKSIERRFEREFSFGRSGEWNIWMSWSPSLRSIFVIAPSRYDSQNTIFNLEKNVIYRINRGWLISSLAGQFGNFKVLDLGCIEIFVSDECPWVILSISVATLLQVSFVNHFSRFKNSLDSCVFRNGDLEKNQVSSHHLNSSISIEQIRWKRLRSSVRLFSDIYRQYK